MWGEWINFWSHGNLVHVGQEVAIHFRGQQVAIYLRGQQVAIFFRGQQDTIYFSFVRIFLCKIYFTLVYILVYCLTTVETGRSLSRLLPC